MQRLLVAGLGAAAIGAASSMTGTVLRIDSAMAQTPSDSECEKDQKRISELNARIALYETRVADANQELRNEITQKVQLDADSQTAENNIKDYVKTYPGTNVRTTSEYKRLVREADAAGQKVRDGAARRERLTRRINLLERDLAGYRRELAALLNKGCPQPAVAPQPIAPAQPVVPAPQPDTPRPIRPGQPYYLPIFAPGSNYAFLDVGGSFSHGTTFRSETFNEPAEGGFGSSGMIGFGLGTHYGTPALKGEIEIAHRGGFRVDFDADSIFRYQADASSWTFMYNIRAFPGGLWPERLGWLWAPLGVGGLRLNPYVEAGLGFSLNHFEEMRVSEFGSPITDIDSRTTADFAWMLGFGAMVDLAPVGLPNFGVGAGYRYTSLGVFRTSDKAFPVGHEPVRASLSASELSLRIRYGF